MELLSDVLSLFRSFPPRTSPLSLFFFAVKLVDVVLGRLKELVTSADLVGLLKWRVQPARVSETAQRGGTVGLGL